MAGDLNDPLLMPTIGHVESTEHETHNLFVRAVVMLSLILVSMNINGFLHKKNFHYLGESAVTILLGLLVATIWTAIAHGEGDHNAIQLSSKFFSMVLLPPIIFEGGFTLQRVAFFKNVLTILSLAFIGALYSTFVTSGLMYFFSKLVLPFSFVESLVFGSLISSTDPVTVLSLLPANVDRRLYMLIFGESALNDAVAIILYRLFTGLADPKMRLDVGSIFLAILAAAGVFVGSFVVGVVLGLMFAKLTKHVKMHDAPIYEVIMLFIFAYISYLLADVLSLTGIISVFFCGITMAHYAYDNLEPETLGALKITLRFLSFMCETFIFLYLGLGLLSFQSQTTYSPLMILFACISILIARTHVFMIIGIRNMLQKNPATRIPLNHQILMWFSGLRGAVAFALAVVFLEHPVFDIQVKGMIFGTTVMVVVITVLILGGLTPYMLTWLKITDPNAAPTDGHHTEEESGDQPIFTPAGTLSGKEYAVLENGGVPSADNNEPASPSSHVFAWLYNLDSKYFRPYFTKQPTKVEEEKRPDVDWTRKRSTATLPEGVVPSGHVSLNASINLGLGPALHRFNSPMRQKPSMAQIDHSESHNLIKSIQAEEGFVEYQDVDLDETPKSSHSSPKH